jgi:glucose 1-dehydrogenase
MEIRLDGEVAIVTGGDSGLGRVFLVSDLADYIVCATLFVDGGMSLFPGFEDNG